jgi:cysteine synthase B
MATAIVPGIYDATLADVNLEVGTEEAYRLVKWAAREEGLLLSPSAAAALEGCFRVATSLAPDERAVMVTIFPDSGTKYLSERFWDEV